MENSLLEAKVKEAIISSSTVKELTQKLRDSGIKVKNELEAVILAEDYWIKINDIERGPLENYKVSELKELPFTSIRNNGIEYRIHGIIHDTYDEKVLSEKTKNFIKKQMLKFNGLGEKETSLYEPGMAEAFELETNPNGMYLFEIFPYLLKNYFHIMWDARRLKSIKNNLPRYLYLLMLKHWSNREEMQYKTCKDIDYLPLLREVDKRHQFPMPLEIEKRYIEYSIVAANFKMFSDKESAYYAFSGSSKKFAERIKKFVKNKGVEVLHFVTGLSHEPEIAYYLQHNP
jgi:hypothetical protein